jgi:nucleoside-diphosphate-sugar epimerase
MNCRPYNVGSEIKVSISELAETVAGCFDQKPPVKIATLADHTPAIHAYIPSVKRIREELGLNQTVGLHEAIKKTINFYLDSDQ